jgi:hypothetical protein
MQICADGTKEDNSFIWRFKYRGGDHSTELQGRKKRGINSMFCTTISQSIGIGKKPKEIYHDLLELYAGDDNVKHLIPDREQIANMKNVKKRKHADSFRFDLQIQVEQWAQEHIVTNQEQYNALGTILSLIISLTNTIYRRST